MNSCESHELLISAWLDDELEAPDRLEMTDHLVRCPACREFYREARALDGAVAALAPGSEPAPAHVWERIQRQTESRSPRRFAPPAWALRLAAVLAIAVGAGLWIASGSGSRGGLVVGSSAPDEILVELGGDAGRMSEKRFVELTTEVLRADPRFHLAMYEVMQQVVEDTRRGEGSPGETERAVENGAESEGRRRAARDLV